VDWETLRTLAERIVTILLARSASIVQRDFSRDDLWRGCGIEDVLAPVAEVAHACVIIDFGVHIYNMGFLVRYHGRSAAGFTVMGI
jgi:hypothetical protein